MRLMFLSPLHFVGIRRSATHGARYLNFGIDMYKTSEGFTAVELDLYEDQELCTTSAPLKPMKTCTLIFTPSYNSLMRLQSLMIDTLIKSYIDAGGDFGLAVTQTIKHLDLEQTMLYSTS